MVIIHRQIDASVQETRIETYIVLCGRFPTQVIGYRAAPIHLGKTAVDATGKRIVGNAQHRQGTIAADTLITRFTIAGTEL